MAKSKKLSGDKLLLFHETNNLFYVFLCELVRKMELKAFTKKDICCCAEKYLEADDFPLIQNSYMDFLDEILMQPVGEDVEQCSNFFQKCGNTYTTSVIDKQGNSVGVPILLNEYERRYLQFLLSDSRFRALASERLLQEFPFGYKAYGWNDLLVFRGKYDSDDLKCKKVQKNLLLLMQAIGHGKSVVCDYCEEGGKQSTQVELYPYKVSYSQLTGRLYLICVFPDLSGIKFLRISFMKHLRIYADFTVDFNELLAAEKAASPLVVELRDTDSRGNRKNAVERFFMAFSNHRKRAIYDDNKYVIEMEYYNFDRKNIVDKLIRLGAAVKVLEPADIIEDIVRTAKAAYNNYK